MAYSQKGGLARKETRPDSGSDLSTAAEAAVGEGRDASAPELAPGIKEGDGKGDGEAAWPDSTGAGGVSEGSADSAGAGKVDTGASVSLGTRVSCVA
jgi:hypothetical protein